MTEKRWKSNSEVDRRPRPRLPLLYLPASFVSGAFPCPVLPYQTLNTQDFQFKPLWSLYGWSQPRLLLVSGAQLPGTCSVFCLSVVQFLLAACYSGLSLDSISFRQIKCFSGVKYWGPYCLARYLSLRFLKYLLSSENCFSILDTFFKIRLVKIRKDRVLQGS